MRMILTTLAVLTLATSAAAEPNRALLAPKLASLANAYIRCKEESKRYEVAYQVYRVTGWKWALGLLPHKAVLDGYEACQRLEQHRPITIRPVGVEVYRSLDRRLGPASTLRSWADLHLWLQLAR